jgi:hypothetical protein
MLIRKLLLVVGFLTLLLAAGVWSASGQDGEGQFPQVPIVTTATNSVGLGSYVAAEAYAVAAGEDPAAAPMQAIILPYGIYPDMHVEAIEDFVQPEPAVEGFTFEWSLAAPEGSAAEVMQGTVAIFMTDVEGTYALTLTATADDGTTAEATWNVYASTYIGVGGLGADPPAYPQCGTCHQDKGLAWYSTAHATIFSRVLNGQVTDFAGPDYVPYHTTGFNNRPEAVNGGFDDLAAEAGWTFPDELKEGNWSQMLTEFPQVAALANVQCESCHGPGNLHVTQGQGGEDKMIGFGLEFGTCAQCHATEEFNFIPEQWEVSAHADKNAQAFWYPIGEERTACVHCHSGAGFIDSTNGVPPEEQRTNYQPITCAVCHDPHDAENPNQLRVFDSVVLPDGTEVTGAGPAATCMSCHNARLDPVATVEGESFSTPHYSVAAEFINNTGGYTWGETLPFSPHGLAVQGTCISCHMAATPGVDEPGHNTVGGHTFAMVNADGVENTAVCAQCHGQLESFDFPAKADYDGDGEVESHQGEVDGLIELLLAKIEENGVTVLDSHPYFELPEDASVDLKGAVYNVKLARDDAGSVYHNFKYTVALLQLSYEKLAGEPVPNAEIIQ